MSDKRIEPTVGRVVWFFFHSASTQQAAVITDVVGRDAVHLCTFSPDGMPAPLTHVRLVQPGEQPPLGAFCTWMPYQVGQAAKTEELQATLDEVRAHPPVTYKGAELELDKSPTMNFSDALRALRAMHRVARLGWNGRGMWIALQRPDASSKMSRPYLYMCTANDELVPWVASQSDLLADDWYLQR